MLYLIRLSWQCGGKRKSIGYTLSITCHFTAWRTLTHAQKCNLYLNVRYIIQTINVNVSAHCVKLAGSLPFMQLQGFSNQCGVCAINNLCGAEVTTVHEMNKVADELWLEQFENLELSMIDDVQRHRDSNGFHSLDTLSVVASKNGLMFDPLHGCIQSILGEEIKPESPALLIRELQRCYNLPVQLLILDADPRVQHYTVVIVYHHTIWHLDSMKPTPNSISANTYIIQILQNHLQRKVRSI